MLVSPSQKFVFIHVHKAAGISMERLLQEQFPDAKHWYGRHGHAIDGIGEIGRERWDEYYSFGFVRNPWDRLVSWYAMIERRYQKLAPWKRWKKSPFGRPFWDHAVRDAHDFESFLHNCTAVIEERGCRKSFAFNQLDYLSDENGEPAVDFVGRFENIAHDFSEVCERLEIDPGKLGQANATKHRHYSEYYTPQTRDLVGERFRRDIEAFGYEFEGSPSAGSPRS